jgi:hypothetical protein
MTKFLKADNGEILTAVTDLKSGREAKITLVKYNKKTVHDEILKG